MSTSQNGWPVLPAGSTLDKRLVDGAEFTPGVRPGDVATVLYWVAQQIANRVEKPIAGDCWGYAYRAVRGQTSGFSNHASGTAIDYNAPAHDRQSTSRYLGYSTAQVTTIHGILAQCGGLVRWGGDYTTTPFDPMHFEINGTPTQVAALAAKLTGGDDMPAFTDVVPGTVSAKFPKGVQYGPLLSALFYNMLQSLNNDAAQTAEMDRILTQTTPKVGA